MKTKGMGHQIAGLERAKQNLQFGGNGCEQGTGKTWMELAFAEYMFKAGEIQALVIIAPKGVHINWTRREIPKHLEIDCDSYEWQSSPGVKRKAEMARLLKPGRARGMPVLAMNIDAVITKLGFKYLTDFLSAYRCHVIVDESSRIKNLKAGRTERLIGQACRMYSRRIASGTMMPNGPPDLFSQFEFMKPKGALLGTKSYFSYVNEFAYTLEPTHPMVVEIMERQYQTTGRRPRFPPQIIATDANGTKRWKNLTKLQELVRPHVYRVLKEDCLDLPPKVFETYSFKMEPKQKRVYDEIESQLRYERESGQLDEFNHLTKLIKLRQAVSNFIMLDGQAHGLNDANPRLDLFREIVQDTDGSFIVWCSFTEEIHAVAAALADMGIDSVKYYGDVKDEARQNAIDDFQAGKVRAFIGQVQAGIGITLTKAQTAIFYSNNYNAEDREQDEDRCHRKGSDEQGFDKILYIDIVAEGTIDERIIAALQAKKATAQFVMNNL